MASWYGERAMKEERVVHCKKNAYDVYIGRGSDPNTGERGRWGNPFSHKENTSALLRVSSRERAIAEYKGWLWHEINEGRITLEDLAALDGKTLGCWCKPKACHGDVLAAAATWAASQLRNA